MLLRTDGLRLWNSLNSRTRIGLAKICSALILFGCGLSSLGSAGCQQSVGGDCIHRGWSPNSRDEVQVDPADPEDQLANQKAAVEEYKLQREGFVADEE